MLNNMILRKSFFITFSLLFVVTIFLINTTSAQSGRRGGQPIPPTAPVIEIPVPKSTPVPTPAPKPTPQVVLKIVRDIRASAFSLIQYPENTNRWIVERLENSRLLEIQSNVSGTLKEAKQMAVNAENEYVVFIQLSENSIGVPQSAGLEEALREIRVNFFVFNPKTAKTKQSGTTYLKPELLRSGNVMNQRRLCYPTLRDVDYLLLRASFEAAERIMSGLSLPIPAEKCSNSPTFFSSLGEM